MTRILGLVRSSRRKVDHAQRDRNAQVSVEMVVTGKRRLDLAESVSSISALNAILALRNVGHRS